MATDDRVLAPGLGAVGCSVDKTVVRDTLPPKEFESLETFLGFYGRQQDHANRARSLETELTDARQRYEEARNLLSRVLPPDVLLHYTYEGRREELRDQQYWIMNAASAGEGQIRLAPGRTRNSVCDPVGV